jgi:hypothetical protein
MTDRLKNFLALVRAGGWRSPTPTWNEELRSALSDGLVKVGWGGVLELTDVGRSDLSGMDMTEAKAKDAT